MYVHDHESESPFIPLINHIPFLPYSTPQSSLRWIISMYSQHSSRTWILKLLLGSILDHSSYPNCLIQF